MDKQASLERTASAGSGFVCAGIALVAAALAVGALVLRPGGWTVVVFVVCMLVSAACLAGL